MKIFYFLISLSFFQSCTEKSIIQGEKTQIRNFVKLVSESKYEQAIAKVELPSESQFGLSEYNLELLSSIFNKSSDLLDFVIEKSESKKGKVDGLLLTSNYYEIPIDQGLYDTSLYANVKLTFCFDRSLKKKNITLINLTYDQKTFLTPNSNIRIKNIFDEKDTIPL
jgi:hypothetical protein